MNTDNIRIIVFDADDTLWDCQGHFEKVMQHLYDELTPWVDRETAAMELFATERKNMPLLGYGVKAFTLSMLETAMRVSRHQMPAATINDILQELQKPGRDPRESAREFSFADDIHEIDDLKPGMELPGIVTNLTAFGAFVDIGLHENGLIHASQMGVKGMAVPSKILKLHQQVKVQVISVDLERSRIGLRLLKD